MNDFVTAIQRGKPGPVREMLDRSPELVSMYHAGSFGGTGLIQAVLTDEGVMVDLLLDAGANINAASGRIHKNEPLGWAIVSGASEAVRVFLECGAVVSEGHRKDAELGAKGELRNRHRDRPLKAWVEIRDRLLESN